MAEASVKSLWLDPRKLLTLKNPSSHANRKLVGRIQTANRILEQAWNPQLHEQSINRGPLLGATEDHSQTHLNILVVFGPLVVEIIVKVVSRRSASVQLRVGHRRRSRAGQRRRICSVGR